MCGGGSKTKNPVEPKSTYTPNPNAIADTSNDYSSRRGAIVASTSETNNQPSTFGSELGGA